MNIWVTWTIRAVTMLRRNNPILAMIFLVVVTASPATTRTVGTYIKPKRPNGSISGPYNNPVILATVFGDVSAVWVVISIPPNLLGFIIMFHSYDYFSSEWFKKYGIGSSFLFRPLHCIPNN
jgi:hypothetical protein